MNNFEVERFNIYCTLLSEYIKKPTEKLKRELEAIRNGLVPVKYLIKSK